MLRTTSGFVDVETADGIVRCRVRGPPEAARPGERTWSFSVTAWRSRSPARAKAKWRRCIPRRTPFFAGSPCARRWPPGGRSRRQPRRARLRPSLMATTRPFHARMLDRFLVISEHNDITPWIIANQSRLGHRRAAPRADHLRRHRLSPLRDRKPARLRPTPGVAGASPSHRWAHRGVRRPPRAWARAAWSMPSTPTLDREVAATSTAHGKGRHTTRVATLFPFAGGYLADTPGIRELGLWSVPSDAIDRCFPEMRPLLGEVRVSQLSASPRASVRHPRRRRRLHRCRALRKLSGG